MTKTKSKILKYTAAVCMAACLISGITAGVTYAYLRADPGTALNVITVGKISIDLEEKSWNRENAQELHPGETVSKDPVIVNTGENPAYVFLEVVVPMRDIAVVNAEGRKTERKVQDLFRYEADTAAWEMLDQKVTGGNRISVYGCRRVLLPEEKTEPLFTEISAVNYLEGCIDPDQVFEVQVTAKAIQDKLPAETASLAEVYSTYLQQTELDLKQTGEEAL